MKFILMMHAPRGTGDWDIFQWPTEARAAHADYWQKLNDDLRNAGELVGIEGLAPPGQARVVRSSSAGEADAEPIVSDGPFPEAKEFLAGYWIIEVTDAKRAHAIAARASAAPGPNGAPLAMPIEVREVMFSVK